MGVARLNYYRDSAFWGAVIILLVTVFFSAVAYLQWYSLSFFVGSLFFVHWLGLAAAFFIAALVPIYYVLKRKKRQNIKTLLKLHVFGNLFSFLLISIHFAQNTGRLAQFYPRLEDGFILFLVLSIIVASGMIERFGARPQLVKYTKPVHTYTVAIFYLVLVIHVMQGFNIL
jgi:hypothetical protein